ncbi:MAG: helix-turn-helix domain-containing protein [Pseudomonadota bacterium]
MSNSLRPTTKDAIIEAAFAILSRDPSAALSDIADQAGVGRATLHRHFASRDDLVRALALIAIEEMDDAAEAACENTISYAEAFQNMLTALIPLGDRHGFLAREPIDDDPDIATAFERQQSEMDTMVAEAKAEGLFDKSVPTSWITQAFDHLLYAAWESVKSGETPHQQAADLAWRTLTIGLIRRDI